MTWVYGRYTDKPILHGGYKLTFPSLGGTTAPPCGIALTMVLSTGHHPQPMRKNPLVISYSLLLNMAQSK